VQRDSSSLKTKTEGQKNLAASVVFFVIVPAVTSQKADPSLRSG
jgi:hypothetical protein